MASRAVQNDFDGHFSPNLWSRRKTLLLELEKVSRPRPTKWDRHPLSASQVWQGSDVNHTPAVQKMIDFIFL